MFTGSKPDIGHLRIYGSKAYALINKERRSKFDPKSEEMLLVGYAHKAYRLWKPGTRRVMIRRDVIIVEPQPKEMVRIVMQNDKDDKDEAENTSEDIETEDNCAETKKEANKKLQKKRKKVIVEVRADSIANQTRSKTQSTTSVAKAELCTSAFIANVELPTTVEEAKMSPEAKKWELAMTEELDSLKRNKTWTLVKAPEDRKPIRNKWVFRLKTKHDGIDRYKARLVAKGCSQKPGIDFTETFSPVARFDSVRTLLAVAASKDFEIVQLDVKAAFLYGNLTETIYMEQPGGCNEGTNRVCLLNKSLYGLRQAPRQWHAKFDNFMREFDLKSTNADPCIYTSKNGEMLVALYVDDGLVFERSKTAIDKLLKAM